VKPCVLVVMLVSGLSTVSCGLPGSEVPVPSPAPLEKRVVAVIAAASERVEGDLDSASAWGNLGAVLDAHWYFPEAAHCYRQAMEKAPGDFRWTYFLAISLDREGSHSEEVADLFSRAVEMEPRYPPVHYRQGSMLLRQGQLQPARKSFERALELDPKSAVIRRQLGRVLLAQGDLHAARVELERALQGDPRDASTHSALAQIYARLGLPERSREAANAAGRGTPVLGIDDPVRLEVSSLGVSAFLASRRGQAALAAGRAEEALELLRIKDEVSPSASNDYFLGLAFARMGRSDDAAKYFRQAITKADYADAHWQLAELLLTQGRREEAVAHLRLALVAGSGSADLVHGVGTSLARIGELQDAIEAFSRAGYLDPGNAILETDWCGALLQAGKIEESLIHCARAVALDEASSRAHFHLGLALDSDGRNGEALEHYRRAVELDSSSRAAQMMTRQ
jgi:tetratricopeptide (TPR) repeat protein